MALGKEVLDWGARTPAPFWCLRMGQQGAGGACPDRKCLGPFLGEAKESAGFILF